MSTEPPSPRGADHRRIVLTRDFAATVVLFVVFLAGMIGYNVRATNGQAAKALQINVATHQEQLVVTYVQDVILQSEGFVADAGPTRDEMEASAGVLLDGGQAPTPNSPGDQTSVLVGGQSPTGVSVTLPRVGDWKLRRKLQQESALMTKLVAQGNRVLGESPASAAYPGDVLTLRIDGDQAGTIATDAAYQLSTDVQSSMARLAQVEVALGVLSGLAALGMALILVRSAGRQSTRFRSLVHNAWDIICVADASGRLGYASPSTDRVLGYPSSSLLGTSVLDLVHPDDRGSIVTSLASMDGQPGATAPIAGRMRRNDGEWRDMEGTATNLVDDPSVGGFVLNGRDVTDARRATDELGHARDEALAAAKAKSEFLAIMSHEIRTPMNAVIGLTELLLDTSLTAEQLEFASGVRVSAENLLVIINDILDFSKIEAGKIDIEAVGLDVVSIADHVGRMLADAARTKGLELLVDSSPDVPTALIGDPVRVQQVLLNLAANAVKFTAHGEVVIRVRLVDSEDARPRIRFEVQDTGIGIAVSDQSRLFSAFSQADSSTTRRYGGTGLGLAICRQLVGLMGGGLGLVSAPDEGSTFWFELSLPRADHPDDATGRPSIATLEGRTALIVDDNATNRLILRKHFHAWGLGLVEATNGYEAIALAAQAKEEGRPIDLAVLDLNMPGMDGLELAAHLRTDPSTAAMALFLLSSSGERLSAADCETRGIAGSLTKPVRVSELLDCIMTGLNPELSASPSAPAASSTRSDGAGRHILIVEDNKMNQLVASRVLERLGYTFDVADNGRLAVEAITARSYDAVLMDCQMPEMDGYEATAEIRRLQGADTHTPIIAMTAAAMEGDRDACLTAGMDDYITKPVRPDVVGAVLRRWTATGVEPTDEPPAPVAEGSTATPSDDPTATPAQAPPASAITDSSGPDPLDSERLATLRGLDDGAGLLLAELAAQFLEQTTATRSSLATALDTHDAAGLARAAHLVKGAAANIGAAALADVCAELERYANDGRLDETAGLLEQFDDALARARIALDALAVEPTK